MPNNLQYNTICKALIDNNRNSLIYSTLKKLQKHYNKVKRENE
jgi:hypothetical protein